MKRISFLKFFNVICLLLCIFTITSCEPKYPKPLSYYSAEELKYHPIGDDGVPIGYSIIYSRSGINSIDYVKKEDLQRFNIELKKYEDFQRQKILRDEYGVGKEDILDEYGGILVLIFIGVYVFYNIIKYLIEFFQ